MLTPKTKLRLALTILGRFARYEVVAPTFLNFLRQERIPGAMPAEITLRECGARRAGEIIKLDRAPNRAMSPINWSARVIHRAFLKVAGPAQVIPRDLYWDRPRRIVPSPGAAKAIYDHNRSRSS